MANTKITDLSPLTAADGDELPVNRSGSDGKVTAGDIAALAEVVNDTTPQLGGDLDGQSTYDLTNIVDVEIENDLLFASGSIINWDSGDVTLTHSANTLTLAGGNLTVGSNSFTAGSLLAASDDVGALGASGTAWSDLFLASGAVINFNADDITLTHSANLLTFAGGDLAIPAVTGGNPATIRTAADFNGISIQDATGNSGGVRLHTGTDVTTPSWIFSRLSSGAYQMMMASGAGIAWCEQATNVGVGTPRVFIRGPSAANIIFGSVDAASPVAQTLSVQNVVAGTSNTAGAAFTIAGSRGTGTGDGGHIVFQTAAAGGSGSSQNSLAEICRISTAGLELGHATDTTLTRAAAGALAVEGTRVAMCGKQTIWVPAGSMMARTTSGAESTTREINSITVPVLAFSTSADEGANFSVAFPKSWGAGTVTYQAFWTTNGGSSSQTVEFELRGGCFANDAAINVTGLGTAVAQSDTWIANNDVHVSAESSAVTLSNAAADTVAFFEIIRDVSDDDIGGDVELIGIKLFYTTTAGNDA